ncbi:putative bifunctional diguanylate cyclase/phosphodiesterase [Peribacillus sp. SCS-155]|uniref:putative bifunctional diguanylate cyclase/phosphodiesterase n=1 Tax=Peribacillus sedimenti TaxID=3115297 RepID=UPI003905ECB4
MFTVPQSDVFILHGEYSMPVVVLSIIIACCASYTALSLNERIQQNSFFPRSVWIGLASLAMGFGIWSMHFIGMGAFMLPVSMKYDPLLTIFSVIPALLASHIAFYIANRPKRSLTAYVIAGTVMGLGIASMHYIGMEAMEMAVEYAYRPWIFIFSILIAIAVSFIALYIFEKLQLHMNNRFIKIITAALMGLAISSMHYTGMAAVVFYQQDDASGLNHEVHEMGITILMVAVTVGIVMLLGLSGLSGILDRYVDHRLNFFDSLTKLPNRRQFEKSIDMFTSAKNVAVVHLHGLEKWNSGFGYEFGDQIIRTVSTLLLQLKPPSSEIYRIEGNRFALIGYENQPAAEIKTTLERLCAILRQPLIVQEQSVLIDMVAVVSARHNGENASQLFANAIAVLHHPLTAYEHQVVEYDPNVHIYNREQQLVNDIDQAMANDELYLAYQPKVCPFTQDIMGLEALIRWNHPVHGPLSPAMFIPVMEEGGKLFDVTDWVIDRVCLQISEWQKKGMPAWQVAVNIPGPYITSSRLIRVLKDSVAKHGIKADNLELEMTETSVVSNIENAIRSVGEIRRHGFSVALDDFGTGVSSLSYLQRLPISTLKIDKSFVDRVPDSDKDSAIIKAIISLCHTLGFKIVVEGVESAEQWEFLTHMPERPVIQGYYFAKPMTADELTTWFSDSYNMRKQYVE